MTVIVTANLLVKSSPPLQIRFDCLLRENVCDHILLAGDPLEGDPDSVLALEGVNVVSSSDVAVVIETTLSLPASVVHVDDMSTICADVQSLESFLHVSVVDVELDGVKDCDHGFVFSDVVGELRTMAEILLVFEAISTLAFEHTPMPDDITNPGVASGVVGCTGPVTADDDATFR